MGHDKVMIQQELLSYEHDLEKLKKEKEDICQKVKSLTNLYGFYVIKEKELSKQIEPLQAEINNNNSLIPSFEADIARFKEQINNFKQQIEFSKQIKALNLEDIKYVNNGNSNVNTNLLTFIKKFEEIQRLSNIAIKTNTNI